MRNREGLREIDDCPGCGGEGYSSHDCGEDTCCCLDPEDNVLCEQCAGKGWGFVAEDEDE